MKRHFAKAVCLALIAAGSYSTGVMASDAENTSLPDPNNSVAADYPVYSNNTLTIPTVGSDNNPATYLDVELVQTEAGKWQLTQARQSTLIDVIENVEVVKVDSFPVQIFLRLTGTFNNGCGQFGKVISEQENNLFQLSVYYEWYDEAVTLCTENLVPFDHLIPLTVYDLDAGEYQYTLNKNFSGSFLLEQDNRLDYQE
ncbi:hypothetical protein [Oceanospirillum sediminis]|uniref:Uncharacterized protein n=1 Tax=Oceanospirillum sediminis TaxID=2760088 RepID=A0A839IP22_9GAMM|nr:hypothetical protein [Oceanospirillum sediminis]MBB1487243.1 hypothetical protein [Oceanospirillum sediminis]